MKKQEIFDKVVKHLFKQKKPAKTRMGNCKYRTPDGLKCAVGALIPDDVYSKKMEGSVDDLQNYLDEKEEKSYSGFTQEKAKKLMNLKTLVDSNNSLLSDLQGCHDDNNTVECGNFDFERLKEDLLSTAKRFKIKTTHLKQLQ